MNERHERIRPFIYLAVIGMAFTLPHPWMAALQAAAGGVGLGAWLWRRKMVRN